MKYAIISDIHANLEALEVCFGELDKLKPEKTICLGDLVDYCAEPNIVIELIKERCDVVLLGNHDEAQYRHELVNGFSENAAVSSVHTRSIITAEHVEYFKSLPASYFENDLLFVHASPYALPFYQYILNEETAEVNFDSFIEKICFIGHSHVPLLFKETEGKAERAAPGKLERESRYIINVGSVGQPRDGDPKLSFGLFDSEKFEYKNIRLDYDIESASRKILAEGLPERLAKRLFAGI